MKLPIFERPWIIR